MFSTIALTIIAIAICILIITYYRERTKLVQQLLDIDNSLSEMRTSLNKLEYINNKMLAVENKVQNCIDKANSVKTYITNDISMNLTSIKASQDVHINKFHSKVNKLQDTIDVLAKENAKRHQDTINSIDKKIVDSECRTGVKLNTINERLDTIGSATVIALEEKKNHCEAKNSSKISKAKHTTKTNKQESDKLKTAE